MEQKSFLKGSHNFVQFLEKFLTHFFRRAENWQHFDEFAARTSLFSTNCVLSTTNNSQCKLSSLWTRLLESLNCFRPQWLFVPSDAVSGRIAKKAKVRWQFISFNTSNYRLSIPSSKSLVCKGKLFWVLQLFWTTLMSLFSFRTALLELSVSMFIQCANSTWIVRNWTVRTLIISNRSCKFNF